MCQDSALRQGKPRGAQPVSSPQAFPAAMLLPGHRPFSLPGVSPGLLPPLLPPRELSSPFQSTALISTKGLCTCRSCQGSWFPTSLALGALLGYCPPL